MPSVNLRQLRDTRKLKAWLRAGETVELRERNTILAQIVPEKPATPTTEWPDFEERRRRMWGDRVFDNAAALDYLREDRF